MLLHDADIILLERFLDYFSVMFWIVVLLELHMHVHVHVFS